MGATAYASTDTGELCEQRLEHKEEAEQFYRELKIQGREVTRLSEDLAVQQAYWQLCRLKNSFALPGRRSLLTARNWPPRVHVSPWRKL